MTIPAYLILAAIALLGAPIWVCVGFALDALDGQARARPRTRALAFFTLYFACEAAGILGSFFLWLCTLGGRVGGPSRYVDLNAALQRWWSGALFSGSRRLFSMRVSIEARDVPLGGPLLLFVRHTSTADAVLAAAFVANPLKLLLRYVIKRELLWDPCLDIVGQRLPNAFVKRRGPGLEGEIAAIAGLAEGLDARSGVLIYPEGMRFTESRREAAMAALRGKVGDDVAAIASRFRNVLPPRLRGPLALLDAASGADVVLLEHTGFEGATSFREIWKGSLVGGTLHVRLRRFPASAIPVENRDRWLFERWAEMDRWISQVRGESQAERSDS